MNIYELNRQFWDFAFENTGKIKPNHIAVYQFALEHCNRLGWKKQFGFPTSMVLDATGIKSYSVYKSTFDDLVEYNLFDVIEYSKNQYSSNIIALKENYKANSKANTKALDKAFTKHMSKHLQSTCQSTDSIDIPLYNKQTYLEKEIKKENFLSIEEYEDFREYEFSNLDEKFKESISEKVGITRPIVWCNKKHPNGYFDLVDCLVKVRGDPEWRASIQQNNSITKEKLLIMLYEFVKEIKDSKIYLSYDGHDASDGKENFITHFSRWLRAKLSK